MQAWIVERLSPEGELRLAEVPLPEPAGDEARIRVAAVGLNFLDTLVVKGQYQVKPKLPFSPGVEVAGQVTAAGPDSSFRIGEMIAGNCDFGGFAEEAIVRASGAFRMPAGMTPRDAVALLTIYPTAHLALRHRAGLKAGETVLVTAAVGGVGSATLQLAKHWGARVIAAAGGAAKVTLARELGADHVIDYREEKLIEGLRRLAPDGVDVAVDSVGGAVTVDCLRALAWGGRLMIVGFAGGQIAELPSNRLLLKNAAAMGVYWGEQRRHDPALADGIGADLLRLHAAGAIRPLIR
ncbi:MAG: NADPH:quinone oxidoreductase family protein, partial [Stellaceae bacterium]